MQPDDNENSRDAATAQVHLVRHQRDGTTEAIIDAVAVEEPLELRVEGKSVAVIMRTPGHDEELAAGFLLTEGVVTSRSDIFEISACAAVAGPDAGNVIDVLLARPDTVDLTRLTRHVFSASSCGVCGKATIESVQQRFPPLTAREAIVSAALIARLPEDLTRHQTAFHRTGGLHAAAIFQADGRLMTLREDVGRHSAVDKVLGRALLDRALPLDQHVLFVSGRISFEIVQKALAARVPVIAGISAPSSLAVDFARESGQTLAGFVRDGRVNLYTGRLSSPGAPGGSSHP